MSIIPADVSMMTTTAVASTPRRLSRLAGWSLAAVVSGGLWAGVALLVRLAL